MIITSFCFSHLEVLIMHRVHISSTVDDALSSAIGTLRSLHDLRQLDISNSHVNSQSHDESVDDCMLAAVLIHSIVCDSGSIVWRQLDTIDMSGNHFPIEHDIERVIALLDRFVQLHSTLNLIAIFDTVISSCNSFVDNDRLKVCVTVV